MARVFRNVAVCPALLRALRTKSILFSAIARPPLAPSSYLRMAKRHGRRASRSRRGIKDWLRRIDERENNRVRFAVYNRRDDNARRKCSRTLTRTRACFAGKETIPYRRQLYSRRKIVSTHARARDAIRAHTSAHAARNKRETSTMDLITKSGTISWEFAGNGDLRNSPDCCGSYGLRCFRALRVATHDRMRDLWRARVHAPCMEIYDLRVNSIFS